MGNYDRIENLEMLGELDEKYIKEADAYLSAPLMIDDNALRLAPERRKFSWQAFVAIAACAAVLIGGTFALRSYLNRVPVVPPVDASSDSVDNSDNSDSYTDSYLEEIRERYNVIDDINISYLEGGWEWSRFETSGEDDGLDKQSVRGRLDEYNTAFLDKNTMLTVRKAEDGDQEIAAYDLTAKTFRTIFGRADETPAEGEWGVRYQLFYADENYIVFGAEKYGKIDEWLSSELRILNLSYSENSAASWKYKVIPGIDINKVFGGIYGMCIEDDLLFFITNDYSYGDDLWSRKLYHYDLTAKNSEAVLICEEEHSINLFSCMGRVIASISEPEAPDKIDSPLHHVYYELNRDGLRRISSVTEGCYIIKNSGVFSVTEKMTNAETGETLFSSLYSPYSFANGIYIEGYSESSMMFRDSENGYVFDAENNELYVDRGCNFEIFGENWIWYQLRGGFCALDISEENCVGYILTRKSQTDDKPVPEKTEKQKFLDKFREEFNVSPDVGVAYARDRLNVIEYSLPQNLFPGADFAADNGRLFIDSSRAIVSDIYMTNRIEMYLLDTDEVVTLIRVEDDPQASKNTLYQVYYATKDYVVFTRRDYFSDGLYDDLCVIELNKEGYPCTTISRNQAAVYQFGVLVDENTVYYAAYDKYVDDSPASIYKYEIGKDAEPELYVEEGVPLCVYNGDLLYFTMSEDAPEFLQEIVLEYRIIHSVSGTLPIEGKTCADVYFCKYGLFTVEDGKLIDCVNNKVIMYDPPQNLTPFRPLDFGVAFGQFNIVCLYDARTNEVLVFEEGDSIREQMAWASCYWGLCGYNADGYLICEK